MINDSPNSAEELQRAAERLHDAAGGGPRSASYDQRIAHALSLLREGSVDEGRRELQTLADAGSEPARTILSRFDAYTPESLTKDDRMHRALSDIRHGRATDGFAEMVDLADRGYGPAAHFLAWLHRYRAVEILKFSEARFLQALSQGYAPSERHLVRVQEALKLADFSRDQRRAPEQRSDDAVRE